MLYQSCPNFSRVMVFSRPVLYGLFQCLCQCQSVSLSTLSNILECVWWWWCFIMAHVPKTSRASGVQAEGSDFEGTIKLCKHWIFMIGVPNIAKLVIINSIHQIASSCFPGKLLLCYARLCLNVIVFNWNYGEVY